MMTRIITGACLVAVLAFALAMGGWVFSVLYMASICVSMYEVYRAMGEAGHRPVQWPSWLCLVLSVPLFMVSGSVSPLLPLVAGACMLIAMMIMFRSEPRLEDLLMSALPLFCVLLPGMCMLGLMKAQGRVHQLLLAMMAFGVPLVGDTAAYFVGSRFGVRKLCPAVSPNKSVEGAAAGLLGGLAGQMGDLFASLIKRHCGVKDYGTIFPGHGGMMDRLDSVYWATVVMYVYLTLNLFPV